MLPPPAVDGVNAKEPAIPPSPELLEISQLIAELLGRILRYAVLFAEAEPPTVIVGLAAPSDASVVAPLTERAPSNLVSPATAQMA